MFSNTLINNFMTRMSNKNASTLPRKKISKQPQKCSANYIDKLNKQPSAASGFLLLEGFPEMLDSNFLQQSEEKLSEPPINNNANDSSMNKEAKKLCRKSSSSLNSHTKNTVEKETELIGMLTRQLYLATNQMQKMQSMFLTTEKRLKMKDQEIGTLKRKNKDLEAKNKIQEANYKKGQQEYRKQMEQSEYLCKKCRALETRISEMEKFLTDYGLVWVGGPCNNSLTDSLSKDYIENCYTQLKVNIEELNMAAGKDEVQVQHNQDGAGASFKMPKSMNLKFYKNGLIVEGGRLRSYNDPLTKCFIRDILDGYFPSEFQNNYPNGVPLKVEDHRKEIYIGDGADFPGYGYRLGKQTSSQNKRPIPENKSANSWPGSTGQSPVNTNRDHNLQSSIRDLPNKYLRTRSKTDSFTPLDLNNLRLQILASHNHNCSDTHLQSHINAELALSSRKSKSREVATKNTECHLSVRDDSRTRFDKKSDSSKNVQNNNGGNDRSSPNSPSSGSKFRSRSASFSEKRLKTEKLPKIETQSFINSISSPKRVQIVTTSPKIRTPRVTKSATLTGKSGLPFLLQINEPSCNIGELRLKVRSLNGGTVYLIHISSDDTVSRLYQILNKAIMRTCPSLKKYHIVTNGYESKRLDHLQTTLKEYGITRDSVLHLVNG